ncbi:hypothetical protein JOC76_005095 [Neobacillus cucumis]|nr:hypothetical protein [Neobacillus cucumis]MBM7655584.1 hypothetical protein [Neobacillus cucumis]
MKHELAETKEGPITQDRQKSVLSLFLASDLSAFVTGNVLMLMADL